MGLSFITPTPALRADPARADVACFIGFCAPRSSAVPVQTPVLVESFSHFHALFAWNQRPVVAGGTERCATWLGAAVRSFFARGGQRAYVVSAGVPWALGEDAVARAGQRLERLRQLLPLHPGAGLATPAFSPLEPATFRGIHHLCGLPASLVLLPDLPELCADAAVPLPVQREPVPPVAQFVECSTATPPGPQDAALRQLPAPRLDEAGYLRWRTALATARAFLESARHGREWQLVAALPLPQREALHADALPAQLRSWQLLSPKGAGRDERGFVQLAWPWLRTRASGDLPEALEPADGVLAGLIAAGSLSLGTFRSVAGEFSVPRLADVQHGEPVPAWGLGQKPGSDALGQQVCVFAPQPGGWALQSDVVPGVGEAWRFGGVSRLMSCLLRTCRTAGEAVVFGTNNEALWTQLQRAIEAVLLGFFNEGAFAGASAGEAFDVRCDRSTMSQADVDNGRLIVQVRVRPALSVEHITVSLSFGDDGATNDVRAAA